jgi:hypothetical protein
MLSFPKDDLYFCGLQGGDFNHFWVDWRLECLNNFHVNGINMFVSTPSDK